MCNISPYRELLLTLHRVDAMTEEEKLAKEKADAARADAEPEWAKNLSAK